MFLITIYPYVIEEIKTTALKGRKLNRHMSVSDVYPFIAMPNRLFIQPVGKDFVF